MKNWLYALLLTLPLSASANERIVSIGGDVTEIIYALGAEQQLIARDSTSRGTRPQRKHCRMLAICAN